ncbi:WXG100 family type VII secretion target [Actinospica sp.]|jgi:early secretory antigenic target protein ESAT-6|uniref:WXG100 family type VII secretion target n=1 Tax=Actinospica sp. TaxID=1872142 RepID=UPI002B791E05|nr:WXG100 family type VII secretion target [Actinospica sp.]HWG27968.1 WXG100 family type VII secretion target [Actinospica sp.]
MSDQRMLVTFAELANAAQTIQQTSNSLNQKLEDLKSQLKPIVESWQGAAAENYQVQQSKWDSSQTDLNQVLQAIGAAVEQAHDAYSQTETANAQAWHS